MWPNLQVTADLVTFTEKSLNEKLHFLYSVSIGVDENEVECFNFLRSYLGHKPVLSQGDHPFRQYAKYSEKLTLLPPDTHTYDNKDNSKISMEFGLSFLFTLKEYFLIGIFVLFEKVESLTSMWMVYWNISKIKSTIFCCRRLFTLSKYFSVFWSSLSRHVPVPSQNKKHQCNVWNLFQVNNKDNKQRHWCHTSFKCFHWCFEQVKTGWGFFEVLKSTKIKESCI